jgi:hypothetical protein
MTLRKLAGLALFGALAVSSAFAADGIRVVNEGGIRDKWMLKEGVPLTVPSYPAHLARRGDEVCVALGYLVNPDGTLTDFALLKSWSSASGGSDEPEPGYWTAFAEAAGDALKQWRFQPRPEVARAEPVFTVGTFVFGSKGTASAARDHCRIPNLIALLRDLEHASTHRRAPEILSRLDLRDEMDSRRRIGTQM